MRRISLILSFIACFAIQAVSAGVAQAARLSTPGPNPSWTETQKFEWYIGYMARAAHMCGSYEDAGVLHRLARMTPYGAIGLGALSGDSFVGAACGGINARVDDLVVDADKIEAYIEATYSCTDEECYDQKFAAWKSHACSDDLMVHLSKHDIIESDLREVSIRDVFVGAVRQISAQVRLKSCEGSLYIELNPSCRIVKDYTRGDCEVAGVDGY